MAACAVFAFCCDLTIFFFVARFLEVSITMHSYQYFNVT